LENQSPVPGENNTARRGNYQKRKQETPPRPLWSE
jgi:hypothetical protein